MTIKFTVVFPFWKALSHNQYINCILIKETNSTLVYWCLGRLITPTSFDMTGLYQAEQSCPLVQRLISLACQCIPYQIVHTHSHMHTHTQRHISTCMHTRAQEHIHMHVHVHMCTHTHYIYLGDSSSCNKACVRFIFVLLDFTQYVAHCLHSDSVLKGSFWVAHVCLYCEILLLQPPTVWRHWLWHCPALFFHSNVQSLLEANSNPDHCYIDWNK